MIEVVIDGAARGQGAKGVSKGNASCAVIIFDKKKPVAQYARGLGRRTNNEAEYEALITGLLMCTMSNYKDPIFYSDSAVVVNQINGSWKCKNINLLPLYLSVMEIREEYRFRVKQVDRSRVSLADALANKFLDKLESESKRRGSK